MTISCFEKLQKQVDGFEERDMNWQTESPVITELAVISVQPVKNNRPDMFTALIKGHSRRAGQEHHGNGDHSDRFSTEWSFVRQGEWWMLDGIRS